MAELVDELPQGIATQALVDLRIFAREAVEKWPRRERYELSARGLLKCRAQR